MTADITRTLIQSFEQAGQGQVFHHWDSLSQAEKTNLVEQASSIDLAELTYLVETLVKVEVDEEHDFSSLEPAPYKALPSMGNQDPEWEQALKAGEEALRAGRVAAFVVAGGQGTRLGFNGPKGTFPVTPIKGKTLFAVFAEKIIAAQRTYGCTIPWFIMTSKINHDATVSAFQENHFFGLDSDQVMFFSQGLMPAVDFQGKIILSSPSEIAMSPDGHGGSLRALFRSGATEKMKELGIDIISYFQVDNPLVRCIDPTFIGFHALASSDMSSKMVKKAYPLEKVGHFCVQNEKHCVIEYSDMPDDLCEQADSDGALRFIAGSIAIHILDRDFVEKLGSGASDAKLPFHRANKKIPYVAADETIEKPSEPNGVKFEMFVFDALPFAANPVIIETAREDDFSPVKNAEGVDSPETSKQDQMRQFARWMKAADLPILTDETGLPEIKIEISPLFGTDAGSFRRSWKGLEVRPDMKRDIAL